MPWWEYRMAVEGLNREQPWLPQQVELVEGVKREQPDPAAYEDTEAFAEMGLSVTEMG